MNKESITSMYNGAVKTCSHDSILRFSKTPSKSSTKKFITEKVIPKNHYKALCCDSVIRLIKYVWTCVHFKDLKRLEWLAILYTVCAREWNAI